MKINEIIEELKYATDECPVSAIKEARKNKKEIAEILLKNLEDVIKNPDIIFDENLHQFSLFLLAEFREKRAFPLIMKILNQFEEEDLDYLLGDILTENLNSILASTFDGNFYALYNIIDNPEKEDFLRGAVLSSIAILYNNDVINKQFLLDYLSNILEKYKNDNTCLITEIASITCDLKLYELVPQIEEIFINDEFDEDYMTFEDFKYFMDEPPLETYDYINDSISAMSWIYRKSTNFPHFKLSEKIGRNDPCPCGSGKKYKKCCGK